MVLEEVKSLGHPKIGTVPFQGNSLSNLEGSRPPSGAGIPWLKQEVLAGCPCWPRDISPSRSLRFCPLLSQGVRDLTLAWGQWERQVALGLGVSVSLGL